jgi:hypothetical protein
MALPAILICGVIVILPVLVPGIGLIFLIFFNRISGPGIDDSNSVYTAIDVGYVLTLGSIASTVAPMLICIDPDNWRLTCSVRNEIAILSHLLRMVESLETSVSHHIFAFRRSICLISGTAVSHQCS